MNMSHVHFEVVLPLGAIRTDRTLELPLLAADQLGVSVQTVLVLKAVLTEDADQAQGIVVSRSKRI